MAGADIINLPPGTFKITIRGQGEDAAATGDLDITDDLTINGTGTTSPRTVINGNRLDRVFDIHGTANVTISHVAIVNGAADTDGGGIRNQSTGTLTLSSAAIRGNHAGNVVGGNGGGIVTGGGTAMLTDVTITANCAGNGARDGSFFGGNGGGIENGWLDAGGVTATLILTNVTITGNRAGDVPGGAGGGGGGIDNNGQATLTNVIISGNRAGHGHFPGFGGGIENGFLVGGTLTLTNVTIKGNHAGDSIGLVDVGMGGADGGGISNWGTATLTNVTITSNRAGNSDRYGADIGGNGGGIANDGVATLTNVTVNGNRAGSCRGSGCPRGVGGGIAYGATLVNTVVANNVPDNCGFGAGVSKGHNLDSGTSCGFSVAGDLSNTNPMLGPLRKNGGFAPTEALKAGSPALGAGDPGPVPSNRRAGHAASHGRQVRYWCV